MKAWEERAFTEGVENSLQMPGRETVSDGAPPRLSALWKFRSRRYPHFDHVIKDQSEIASYLCDPIAIACHKFLPFIEQAKVVRNFQNHLEELRALENNVDYDPTNVIKKRPIKYASHMDAQVFSYYRHLLAEPYEAILQKLGLNENVIAYRKIKNKSGGGKSNIHFAKDAIDEIIERQNCTAITMDISKFFESLDHKFLKIRWKEILNENGLPRDHYKGRIQVL